MPTRCSDTHYYTRDGLKVANAEADYYDLDGSVRRVVCGRHVSGPGEVHVRDLPAGALVVVGGVSVAVDPTRTLGRRARRAMAPALLALARTDGASAVAPFLDNLSPRGSDVRDLRRGLGAVLGRPAREDEDLTGLFDDALATTRTGRPGLASAATLAQLRPTVSLAPAPERVARLLNRADSELADYYRALDAQHFGTTPTASNFTEFANADEALLSCAERRGLDGDDRALLIALGANPAAFLAPDQCRYLVFPAAGRLGVTALADLPARAQVRLTQEKPGVHLSLVLTGGDDTGRAVHVDRPEVDLATVVIGADETLWTMHPGLPAARSESSSFEDAGFTAGQHLSVAALRDAESPEGIALRAAFAAAGAGFPSVALVKVPLERAPRPMPTWFKRANYSGYALADRDALLEELATLGVTPANGHRVITEHVTYQYPSPESAPAANRIEAYGYVRADGVDALLVRVDGETVRDNGTPYHLTLSVAEGHKPVEAGPAAANAIAVHSYTPLEPFELDTIGF